MTIVIMQPGYLPWMGFFELMHRSDVFVIFDNVQYDKNGWRNRNRIKTPKGPLWLTAPVKISGNQKILEVRIDNSKNWQKDHLRAIEFNYARAPYFKNYFGSIEKILKQKWDFLIDLDMALINLLAEALNLKRKIIFSSHLKTSSQNNANKAERLILICREFKADVFYEPAGGKNYLAGEEPRFKQEGVELIFQNFRCPSYSQLFGQFVPDLSVIDLLFNEGEKSSDFIIKGGLN